MKILNLTAVLFLITPVLALAIDKPYRGTDPQIPVSKIISDMKSHIDCHLEKGGILTSLKRWYVTIGVDRNLNSFSHSINREEKWSGKFDRCQVFENGDVLCEDQEFGRFEISFESKELWIRRCNALDRLGGCFEKLFYTFEGIAKDKGLKFQCDVGVYRIPGEN